MSPWAPEVTCAPWKLRLVSALITAWVFLKKPDLFMILNGCLAGLVGITASCAFVSIGAGAFIGFVAGVLAVLATYLLKEQKRLPRTEPQRNGFFSFLSYWKTAPKQYRQLLIGLLAFALFNSSDVFLLLKAREAGVSDTAVIGLYMFYNLVYAIAAYPLGILADRIGLKRIYIAGLLMFALVYAGMSQATSLPIIAALFLVYGLFSAATEGISKAWITNISAREDSATAIGTYTGFQSICSLLASSITGFVWFQFGGMAAFIGTALVTLCVAFYLLRMPEEVTPEA